MVTQQRKAMGPRLVEKFACTVAPHGCHPQSQCHWFQEKENDTCTLNKINNILLLLFSVSCLVHSWILHSIRNFVYSQFWSKIKLRPNKWSMQHTLCSVEWYQQGQSSHLGKTQYHLHAHFLSASIWFRLELEINLFTESSQLLDGLLIISTKFSLGLRTITIGWNHILS